MSINIGNEGVEAARALHLENETQFRKLRDALLEQGRVMMNRALDCTADERNDNIGYARAIRDVWIALESAATGLDIRRVDKPGPEVRRAPIR